MTLWPLRMWCIAIASATGTAMFFAVGRGMIWTALGSSVVIAFLVAMVASTFAPVHRWMPWPARPFLPRIVPDRAVVRWRVWEGDRMAWFIGATFRNVGLMRAEEVGARIRFFNFGENIRVTGARPVEGMWCPQGNLLGTHDLGATRSATLHANKSPWCVVVAVELQGDYTCSAIELTGATQLVATRLPCEPVMVGVVLSGDGLPGEQQFWFELRASRGEQPTLTQVERPMPRTFSRADVRYDEAAAWMIDLDG